MPDLTSLLEKAPASRRNIIRRWRGSLDADNRAAFDELVDRANRFEISTVALHRAFIQEGLDCSIESFRKYVRGEGR